MLSHDIVISAFDTISALGLDQIEFAAAWAEGESACFEASRATPPAGAAPLAGEVPPFELSDFLATPKAYLDRQAELLLAVAALTRQSGKLPDKSVPAERFGLSLGTAWGGFETLELFFDDYLKKGPRLVKPILFPHSYANAAISLLAMEWELRGPHLNFVSGAAAATQALLAATDMLQSGEADQVLAGGVEALSSVRWRAHHAAGNTMPPGEGAALFLFERRATALARGITPLAYIGGGALGGGPATELEATFADTLARALAASGLRHDAIKRCYANTPAAAALRDCQLADVVIPEGLYGDVAGASAALQLAAALTEAPASLPALIATATTTGSVALLLLV